MTGDADHPHDALQDLVSGRLGGPERDAVDAHLAGCAGCRDLLAALEGAREVLRAAPVEPVPEELRRRVLAALDAEDRMGVPRPEASGDRRARRFGLALFWKAAVVFALVLAATFGVRSLRPPRLVRETAAELRKYQKGESPLSVETQDPAEVSAFFTRAGLPFTPKVPTTRGASCRLKGACLRAAGGRPRSLVAYEDDRGRSLLCSAFPGDVGSLTRGARSFVRNGRTYYVHEVNGVTLVCWQEGTMTNLLASDMPREALLEMAEKEAAS